MMNLTERMLGPKALDYLKETLTAGKSFSRYVLESCDLAQGTIVAFLPSNITDEEANKFTIGGKIAADPAREVKFPKGQGTISYSASQTPNVDYWLIRTIKVCLEGEADSLCLLENALAAVGDPSFEQSFARTWVYDRDVYHVVSRTDATDEKLNETLRKAKSVYPPLIGAVTGYPDAGQLSLHSTAITAEFLKEIAIRSRKIFAGAYDGEGYIIWTKSNNRDQECQ